MDKFYPAEDNDRRTIQCRQLPSKVLMAQAVAPWQADVLYCPRMSEATPRVRRVALPNEVRLVVRGDVLEEGSIREAAARFHRRFPDWGRYGISAFLAANDGEVEALCGSRLERFETIVVFGIEDLLAIGLEVVPTFRTPHATLAHSDLDELVRRLIACPHTDRPNPYHETEP